MNIPFKLIALDLVGALLVVAGILDWLDDGGIDSVIYLIGGFLLMTPLILHILTNLSSSRH